MGCDGLSAKNFTPDVQEILKRIRHTVQAAAPEAEETIRYQIPAFKLNGMLVYFAAFKKHIGLYPPVRGDEKLNHDVAPYTGAKGNLKFPLDAPIPYELIRHIVKSRVLQLTTDSENDSRFTFRYSSRWD
jgi:uncharacterized protein YdhG (YjbR/CyaY superfamily)